MIHVQIDTQEATQGKQIVLNSQLTLLESAKHQNNYSKLRSKELSIKLALGIKLRQILQNIKTLQEKMPTFNYKETENKIPLDNRRLEYELKEIRERLRTLA